MEPSPGNGLSKARQDEIRLMKRRAKVADMYLAGFIQPQIALQIGTSQATVSRDISALHKAWLDSALRDFDALKEIELKRIDRTEREAWDAWRRTIGTHTKSSIATKGAIVTEGVKGQSGFKTLQPSEKTVHSEEQAGDPRFLNIVLKCIEQRRKILGLDAPTKVAPTSPDGKHEYCGFTDEERRREVFAILGFGTEAKA